MYIYWTIGPGWRRFVEYIKRMRIAKGQDTTSLAFFALNNLSKMKAFAPLLSLGLATSVAGHGYMYIPSSRTRLGNEVFAPSSYSHLAQT